jgi:hypothetical protein
MAFVERGGGCGSYVTFLACYELHGPVVEGVRRASLRLGVGYGRGVIVAYDS